MAVVSTVVNAFVAICAVDVPAQCELHLVLARNVPGYTIAACEKEAVDVATESLGVLKPLWRVRGVRCKFVTAQGA